MLTRQIGAAGSGWMCVLLLAFLGAVLANVLVGVAFARLGERKVKAARMGAGVALLLGLLCTVAPFVFYEYGGFDLISPFLILGTWLFSAGAVVAGMVCLGLS
jgi:hypothetical protein